MPFCLRSIPTSLQGAIDIMLSSVRFKSVMVYLEDITVFINIATEQVDKLETVLSILQNAVLTIKMRKVLLHSQVDGIPRTNFQAKRTICRTENDQRRTTDVSTQNQDPVSIIPRIMQRVSKIRQRLCIERSTAEQTSKGNHNRRIHYHWRPDGKLRVAEDSIYITLRTRTTTGRQTFCVG